MGEGCEIVKNCCALNKKELWRFYGWLSFIIQTVQHQIKDLTLASTSHFLLGQDQFGKQLMDLV